MCGGCEDNARPKSPGERGVESLMVCAPIVVGGWRKNSVNY